jgi:hypothetical protein
MLEPNGGLVLVYLTAVENNIISRGEDTNSEEAVVVTKGDYWGLNSNTIGIWK